MPLYREIRINKLNPGINIIQDQGIILLSL